MTRTETFRKDVLRILEENILNFWLGLQDPGGGFCGQVRGDGSPNPEADRSLILNARILWAFSAAWRVLHKKKYLLAATEARDYLLKHFVDRKYGSAYWSVHKDGDRADSKAQLYAQAFAIYGLSEYYRSFRDDEALRTAISLYEIVEKYFADRANGGYIEALARGFRPLMNKSLSDQDINADKTMNSHLHLLEAYANLYRAWPDEGLKQRVIDLLDVLTGKIAADSGHLQLYFDRKWNVLPGGISYGHDIEASWLALECAFAVGDIDVVNKVKPAALKMGLASLEGMQEDGSLAPEKRPDGTLVTERTWWVQAEAAVGHLWMWKYQNVPEGADRALKVWDYIYDHLIDKEQGEWYWACDAGGTPDLDRDKAGPWKCPYHNTRMCLQALSLFD